MSRGSVGQGGEGILDAGAGCAKAPGEGSLVQAAGCRAQGPVPL